MHRSVMLPRCTVSHHVEAICYLQPSACRMPALSTSSRHQSQRRQGVNPCTSSTAYRPVVPSALPASQRLCSSHFYRSKLQQAITVKKSWGSRQVHAAGGASENGSLPSGPTLVWYKHDLRVDDHPGLVAAAVRGGPLLAAVVLDPTMYGHLLATPSGIEGLLAAVEALRVAVRARGGEVVVRQGPLAATVLQLAGELGCSRVVAEEEVEYRWHTAVDEVEGGLPEGVQLQRWQVDTYDSSCYCANFRDFRTRRDNSGGIQQPLGPPDSLPDAPGGLDAGDVPSAADFGLAVAEAASLRQHPGFVDVVARSLDELEAWRAPIAARLVGGEPAVREALDVYLRLDAAAAVEGRGGASDLQREVAAATLAAELPSSPGGSFPAVFGQWLALGLLSRRRVAALAEEAVQAARSKQLLPALQPLPVAVAAAQKWSEAADFHWHLAATDRDRDTKTGDAPRHWRWRGALVDYYTAEVDALGASPTDQAADGVSASELTGGSESSAVADVAGALAAEAAANQGAAHPPRMGSAPSVSSGGGQVRALTRAGYQVYAPTFPGYGRAEKPAVSYSAELWRDFLRDFVLQVVGRPVVVAGNSIGGYIGAMLAGTHPTLCSGLVLLNSAGQIEPGWAPPAAGAESEKARAPPPRLVIEGLSRGLFLFLERSIPYQLKRLYPGDPTNADEWLADEIYRAACDPGALGVFQSAFYLPRPKPLNWYVADQWGGPTLCLQGVLDPLNDARGRAASLKEACTNVELQLVEAGHCPHDEAPAAVNAALLAFLEGLSLDGPGTAPAAEALLAAG
eukprot:CAMPEP_0206150500 /NCGR_PEP_ID=MMETSP1473-20131121/38333_1 /ASSEMBLY_ACC=CAM_ASM_001109 /TAXON_ID=1461547 /ORGANISM="Stichococcus sp, Strain RCC1054" /LENGTH=795 /DNA_ID=CAMNT_0053548005 /DNA_START=103 /DNA_END=2489 /DNA_ORIENTATION=+